MIRDGKIVKTVMRSFSLNEISAVDRPAQQGARATIMKRDDSMEKMTYSMAITSMTGGHSHLITLGGGDYMRRAGDTSHVDGHTHPWIMTEAGDIVVGHAMGHNHGIEVISKGDELDKREFSSKEREAAASGGAAMPDGSYPIETTADLRNAISAFGRAKNQAAVARHIQRRARALGATDLLPDSGKLADLLGKNNDSVGIQNTAEETAALEDQQMTEKSKQAADETAVNEALAEMTKRAERAEALVSMGEEQRSYCKSLVNASDVDAFIAMSNEDRDEVIAKAAASNGVVYTAEDGTEYRKNDDPRLIKMARDMDAEKKKRMKMEQQAYKAELEKRAAELAHIPGDESARVALLKGIDTLPQEERDAAMAALKAQNERLGKAFTTVGTSIAGSDDSLDPLDSMAADIAKRDGISFERAYAKALSTTEGQKLYNRHVEKRMGSSI